MVQNVENHNKTGETDVLVIGGGGAGLSAAVAAAELGRKVTVLEKRRLAGGNMNLAEGLFAAESPVQRRMGIDAQRDHLFQTAMKYAHWRLDAQLVRAFIDKSGDTIRWLEEKGLDFNIFPLYPNQVPLVWHCPAKGGPAIVNALVNNCKDLSVAILCDTAAVKILNDITGKITGVKAKRDDKEFDIRAKNIIIATGGYGGNKTLLKKYCSFYSESLTTSGLPHMGDGILMAIEAGAATEGLGILQLLGPIYRKSIILRRVVEEPDTLWINNIGERFANEGSSFNPFEAVNAVMRQPGKLCYTLLDEKIKQRIGRSGFIVPVMGVLYGGHFNTVPSLDKQINRGVEKGLIKISDSWDRIAEWIGARPDTIKSTIDEYNSYCNQGYDPVFAKDRRYLQPLSDPPYYALQAYPEYLTTIGGIKINHRMEVLDSSGNPVRGLYAAGNDTGGWETDTYCALLSGSTLGFAINSGRIAGENAANQ